MTAIDAIPQAPDDQLVWYAAYGSNMAARRLRCYLEGGCPPGGRRSQPGARDPLPPRQARAIRIPYRLRFADRSRVWGGGKAFINPTRGGWSLACAWLLRREQFDDIRAQESGRRPGSVPSESSSSPPRIEGPYDRVVACGDLDGIPVLTLTSPGRPASRSPSAAYLRMVAEGLAEAHALCRSDAAAYLANADAVGASRAEISRMLDDSASLQADVSAIAG